VENNYELQVQGEFVSDPPMRVIMLNAPPEAGKDTVADYMCAQLRAAQVDFKRRALADKPKEMVAYRHGVSAELMFSRELKDLPWRRGKTPRELVIEFSEAQKKALGQDLWARTTDIDLIRKPRVLVVTDLGFQAEYDYFDKFHKVHLFKIEREGKDYSHDSRKEVDGPSSITLRNDGTLQDLREVSQYLVQQIIDTL